MSTLSIYILTTVPNDKTAKVKEFREIVNTFFKNVSSNASELCEVWKI